MNRSKGTTFADVADLIRYNRAVWSGVEPEKALEVGDNGLGAFQQSTVSGTGPCVALPRSEIEAATGAQGRLPRRLVRVFFGDRHCDAQVRDISPHGIIDMNPDLCKELGITPPWSGFIDWVWL